MNGIEMKMRNREEIDEKIIDSGETFRTKMILEALFDIRDLLMKY